jgi:periplasmic protein CpxP/Spy
VQKARREQNDQPERIKESIMNKRNLIICGILAVGLLAGAGAASARGMGGCGGEDPQPASFGERGGPGLGGHGGMHGMMRGLDLTGEQRDKIFDIQYAQQPAMREKRKELAKNREEIQKAVASKSFDARRVRELANAEAKVVADLTVMRAETGNKVYNLLTPEQQKQFSGTRPQGRGEFGG